MPSELKLPDGISSEEVRVNPMHVLKKIFNKNGKDKAIDFVDSYEASIPERAPTTVQMNQQLMNMREYLQQAAPQAQGGVQSPSGTARSSGTAQSTGTASKSSPSI